MQVLRKRKGKNDSQPTVIKAVVRVKKYPAGTKKEDIDSGVVKPYEVKEGVTDYADDRRD